MGERRRALVFSMAAFAAACTNTESTVRSAFSAKYSCPESRVEVSDLGQPEEGMSERDWEARGCGKTARFECASDCTDDDATGRHRASDHSPHATVYDAGYASAAHDLSCDAKQITRVTARTFEGCGQRASYKIVMSLSGGDDWILVSRVAAER